MVRGSGPRHAIEQAEWRQEALGTSEQRDDCSVGKARRRELVGSRDAEFAVAVVATVAVEYYGGHERARAVSEEKAA